MDIQSKEQQIDMAQKALVIHKEALDVAIREKSNLMFDTRPQSLAMRANDDEESARLFKEAQRKLDEKITRVKETLKKCREHMNEIQTNYQKVEQNSTFPKISRHSINQADTSVSPEANRKLVGISDSDRKEALFRPRIGSLTSDSPIPLWKMDIKPQSFENVHSRIMTPNISYDPPKFLPVFGSNKISKAYYEEPISFIEQFEAVMLASKYPETLWATSLPRCIISEELASLVSEWNQKNIPWPTIKNRFILHSNTESEKIDRMAGSVEFKTAEPTHKHLPTFGPIKMNIAYYEDPIAFVKQFEAVMKASKCPEELWAESFVNRIVPKELASRVNEWIQKGMSWNTIKEKFVVHSHDKHDSTDVYFEHARSKIGSGDLYSETRRHLPVFGSSKINKTYYEEPIAFIQQFEAVMKASKIAEGLWAASLVNCIVSVELGKLVAEWNSKGLSWSVVKDRFITHSHETSYDRDKKFQHIHSKIASSMDTNENGVLPPRLPFFGLKSVNKVYYEETVPFLQQFEAIMRNAKYPEEKWALCFANCMTTNELKEMAMKWANDKILWEDLKIKFSSHNHSAGHKCMSGDCLLRGNETVVDGFHIHELPIIENKSFTEDPNIAQN